MREEPEGIDQPEENENWVEEWNDDYDLESYNEDER